MDKQFIIITDGVIVAAGILDKYDRLKKAFMQFYKKGVTAPYREGVLLSPANKNVFVGDELPIGKRKSISAIFAIYK